MTKSGEFFVIKFTLTNKSDSPVYITRRLETTGPGQKKTMLAILNFKDDKIQFRHYCMDASGKQYQPVGTGGYALEGDIEDGVVIKKGKTVQYSLIYKIPSGFRTDIRYIIETQYQGEIAGKIKTLIPQTIIQQNASH